MSGTQDEIIPREHMVTLWGIAIGKLNPDGTPTKQSSPSKPRDETSTADDSTAKINEAEQEGGGEDPDSKEYVDYETVNGVEIMVSKRTKYRFWREFEGGTHSKYTSRLFPDWALMARLSDDTCVQPGYWAAVWEFINTLVPIPAELAKQQ